jgi:2-dehydropantoate 2-reductase
MRIGIIGGGSIGLLFAYYLSERFNVTIYTKTVVQAEEINQNGLFLVRSSKVHKTNVTSQCFDQWSGKEDLTFIAVKQYQLPDMIKQINIQQTQSTNFVFLQNGMGHLKLLKQLSAKTIYLSSVEHGAYKKYQNTVEHNGVGQARIALYQGELSLPTSIFSISHFPIVMEQDYYEMLLKKLVVNAIINPLTALLHVTNGEIIQNKHYFMVATNLFNEVVGILNIENSESYFNQVLEVCYNTSANRSSMLKDIEANRPTEIDAIVGYIIEEAEKKKMNAPICQMLYHFIKGSER